MEDNFVEVLEFLGRAPLLLPHDGRRERERESARERQKFIIRKPPVGLSHLINSFP